MLASSNLSANPIPPPSSFGNDSSSASVHLSFKVQMLKGLTGPFSIGVSFDGVLCHVFMSVSNSLLLYLEHVHQGSSNLVLLGRCRVPGKEKKKN